MFALVSMKSMLYFMYFSISDEQLSNSRNQLKNLAFNSYVKLEPYANDVQGFFQYVGELRKSIFVFKKEDMKMAHTILQVVKNTYRATKNHNIAGNITMVSIHVRLTDYHNHLRVHYNAKYMSNEFLTQAMSYFTNKYKVILIFYLFLELSNIPLNHLHPFI